MGANSVREESSEEEKVWEIEPHEVLPGQQNVYIVEKYLAIGKFAKVTQCTKIGSTEKVAVKAMKKHLRWLAKAEARTMRKLKDFDPDKTNLIRFTEFLEYNMHGCLAFELLDISIYDLLNSTGNKPLNLYEIQSIAQQVIVAVDTLNSIGLSHSEMKPNSIMFVNRKEEPLRVKLIDLSLACNVSGLRLGIKMQPIGYRAPEVMLGIKLTNTVDMWSLGCIMALMYLGQNLLPHEYTIAKGSKPHPYSDEIIIFEDMVRLHHEKMNNTEYEDTEPFLNFLKQMLSVDPQERITPKKALQHCFIATTKLNPDHLSNSEEDEQKKISSSPNEQDALCKLHF
uniref:Protein kinase domain-containing protein n=1 Tax=Echeneis naucrates TaxID=173247 RepID=A0A665VZJ1_ECHNA